ncbi:large ribosomal subunit protein bL35m [Prorops nasuta]|uniref:large ribosomal subunit protein bL35m n=1 Tax=Prorops nasuta TaxID=863751 RepID=UPI0034CF9375
MLRFATAVLRGLAAPTIAKHLINIEAVKCLIPTSQFRHFSILKEINLVNMAQQNKPSLLPMGSILSPTSPLALIPSRSVTKFSMQKGKRKSVKTVLKRFYRLNWGMWIRTIAGRHNSIWRKRRRARYVSRQHVMTNSTQSYLLDKMVTNYWRRPRFYPDDPYNPYHTREEYRFTRKNPVD